MDSETFLIAMAQISLAFTAVAGVVTILRSANAEWSPQEKIGLIFIFEHSFGAFLLSLIPDIVWFYSKSEKTVWLLSSIALGLFFSGELLLNLQRSRRTKPRRLAIFWALFVTPSVLFAISEFLNALWWESVGLYLTGLLVLVIQGIIQFALLLSPPKGVGTKSLNE